MMYNYSIIIKDNRTSQSQVAPKESQERALEIDVTILLTNSGCWVG